jgi:hypothetical protein
MLLVRMMSDIAIHHRDIRIYMKRAPRQGLDSGDELVWDKGLDHIVICSYTQSIYDLLTIAISRDDQYRNMRSCTSSEPSDYLEPRSVR